MIIDWKAAPEGTTHGMTVGLGEMRWYRVGEYVECWSVTIGWTQSFFLTKEEFNDAGLHLYEYGEQSELVMLRLQHEALMEALKFAKSALGECYDVREWPANGDSTCDHAILAADKAIAFVEGTK